MPEFELSSIKPYEKIMIDNQVFIFEEIRYRTGDPGATAELKLRTLRMYEPYEVISLASYHPQKYYWRPEIVKDYDIEGYLDSQGITWTRHDISSVEFFLPPTPEQYASQETIVMNYQYEVRWRHNNIDDDRIVNMVTTWYPTLVN